MPKLFKSIDVSDENERLIGGWASIEVVDKQGDIVPIEELEKAMMKLMDRGGYIFFGHQNKPVGKILKWEVKDHPELGVKGVYIVAKIFKDYKLDDEVWDMIKRGVLKGFSIGGRSNKQEWAKAKDGSKEKVRILKDIELGEISIVSEPANPYATLEEVNYFAKGDVGSEDDDMEEQDYVDAIDKHIVKKGELWRVVSEKGDILAEFSEKGMAIDYLKALENNPVGRLILIEGKSVVKDVFGEDVNIVKIVGGSIPLRDVIKVTGIGVDSVIVEKAVKELVKEMEETLELFKKVDERYLDENGKFKEMSCPDNPSEKNRFCGCVRAMMAQGKSLEQAKKICGYIKYHVKKGSVEIMKPNDLRPPKEWWDRCISRTGSKRLCGWVYYHHLDTETKEGDKASTREARRRRAKWEREE